MVDSRRTLTRRADRMDVVSNSIGRASDTALLKYWQFRSALILPVRSGRRFHAI
jgi:hypothetical protein